MVKMGSEKHWVDFKYEQVPIFCFYCGIFGHQERSCKLNLSDAKEGQIIEGQYGDWIRASMSLGGKKGSTREGNLRNQSRELSKARGEEIEGEQGTIREIQALGKGQEGVRGERFSKPMQEGNAMQASEPQIRKDQVFSGVRGFRTAQEITCSKNANMQLCIFEEVENKVPPGPASEGKECTTGSGIADLIKEEGVQNRTNKDRQCLGSIDQNILRDVTVECGVSKRTGIGK